MTDFELGAEKARSDEWVREIKKLICVPEPRSRCGACDSVDPCGCEAKPYVLTKVSCL